MATKVTRVDVCTRKTQLIPGKRYDLCFSWPAGTTSTQMNVCTSKQEILGETKMPNWRHVIAAGKEATTNRYATETTYHYTPGVIQAAKWCSATLAKSWSYEIETGCNDNAAVADLPAAPPQVANAEVDGQARIAFVKNARSAQGSFQGSTFVGELAETIRMIRNPARAIREGLDAYHRTVSNRLRRELRGRDWRKVPPDKRGGLDNVAAQTWLEYSFGWKPAINDVISGYKAYREFAKRQPRVPVRGYASLDSAPIISFRTVSNRCVNKRYETHLKSTSQVVYYGAVKCQTEDFYSSVVEASGFRFRDFIPTMWELTPWSFLVDYFTNVGDLIELASFPRSDVSWVSRTFRNISTRDCTRVTWTGTSSAVYPANGAIKVDTFNPSTVIVHRKYIGRTAGASLSVPSLRFKVPGIGSLKWANVAALARLRTL